MSILDFWEYKKNNDLSVKELKQMAREYYTEDFVDNLTKWKNNLEYINELMQDTVSNHVSNISDWENMTYDYFCININNIIENWIDKNKDINPIDIKDITEKLMNDYIKIQLKNMFDKKNTLSNLLISIKKPIIDKIN